MARSTSRRFHVELRSASSSRTSATAIGDASSGRRCASAFTASTSETGSWPRVAASRVHRARSSVGAESGLAGSGVAGCFAFHGGELAVARFATVAFDELRDAVVHLDGDVVRSLRELVEQLARDAGDLGLAVDDGIERDAVAGGQLGAQDRLVEVAERLLMPFQHSAVERVPAAVGGLDLGGDDDVGVELWVVGSARRLAEHADREPTGFGMEPCPVRADAGGRAVLLDHLDRGVDGSVVALGEALVAGESPQHRHRLRCRERRVVAGDRLDEVPLLVDAVEQFPTERLPRERVTTQQDCFETVGCDLADESEVGCLFASPLAGKLMFVLGEVVAVVGRRCFGGAGEQRRHPDHDRSRPPAGTCLRVIDLLL